MTRFKDLNSVEQLRDHQIPETVSLEYKQQLDLETARQRLEALKDLTGLGNGGGGTIIYGVKENRPGIPFPAGITPLTDRTLLGRLENTVRNTVRPPLLVDYHTIEMRGGYLLTADIQPSPLGPYMVEAYDDRRYYLRIGTTTAPMGEQQVRDAYLLAARTRERRPQLWSEHALPIAPPSGGLPWLTISALPEEPLPELLDLRQVTPQDLRGPDSIYVHRALVDGVSVLDRIVPWVDGFFADDANSNDSVSKRLRLYRDGAFGAAVLAGSRMRAGIDPDSVARILNGILIYLTWLWDTFGLTRPVEVHIELHNAGSHAIELGPDRRQSVTPLPGFGVPSITTAEYQLPTELNRASVRHSVVMRFADRLHQAVSERQATSLFKAGQLYGADGAPLQLTAGGDSIFGGMNQWGCLHRNGLITSTTTGKIVAAFDQGVFTDFAGDTLAVLEMATGRGCPDTFQATRIQPDLPGWQSAHNRPPTAHPETTPPPTPTGKWSTESLQNILLQS